MANFITPASLDEFFASMLSANASVLAVSDAYTFDATDDTLDDIAGGVRLGTVALTSEALSGGVFTAAPSLIPTAGGDTLGGFWIYKDTGTESTSRLVLWIDTNADGTAIGGTTSSSGITVPWSSTGIFRVAAVGAP